MHSSFVTRDFPSDLEHYSANVEIELHTGGRKLFPSHAGSDSLIFPEAIRLNETIGELLVKIDGREHRWTLALRPSKMPRRIVEIESHVPF